MKKRFLSIMMALTLALSLLPTAAFAEGEPVTLTYTDAAGVQQTELFDDPAAALNAAENKENAVVTITGNATTTSTMNAYKAETLIIKSGATLSCKAIIVSVDGISGVKVENYGTIQSSSSIAAAFGDGQLINYETGKITCTLINAAASGWRNDGTIILTGNTYPTTTKLTSFINNGTISVEGAQDAISLQAMGTGVSGTGSPVLVPGMYTWESNAWVADAAVQVLRNGSTVAFADDLRSALEYAQDGDTVRLEESISFAVQTSISKNITLDLGGFTLTDNTSSYGLVITGDVTIQNGTILANNNYAGVYVNGGDLTAAGNLFIDTSASGGGAGYQGKTTGVYVNGGTFTLENGSGIKSNEVGIFVDGNAVINVYGSVETVSSYDGNKGYGAIQGSGNNKTEDVASTINIYDGAAVTASKGAGIYHPQLGTLNIYGGTVTGSTGIGMKSGTLNITGGKISAIKSGTYEEPVSMTNGIAGDGSAIIIDSYTGYAGEMNINISGDAELSSSIGYAVREIGQNDDTQNVVTLLVTGGTFSTGNQGNDILVRNETVNVVSVTGGSFSKPVQDTYLPSGYEDTQLGGSGNYEVGKGTGFVAKAQTSDGTQYASLSEAVQHAAVNSTVTLLDDAELTDQLVVSRDLTLDLNNHTITGVDEESSGKTTPVIRINSGTLTLAGQGTVTTQGYNPPERSVIIAGGNSASGEVGLVVGENVTILAPETYGVTAYGTSSITSLDVTIAGTITATGSRAALSGNGNDRGNVTTITIKDGATLTADNYYAIYHPQDGTLNIEGGTIKGAGGIQMCAGDLNITGNPTIIATYVGEPVTVDGGDGAILDGAAVSVINRTGYASDTILTKIEAGTFISAHGKDPVQDYVWPAGSGDDSWNVSDHISISGGAFSQPVNSEYCADNFIPVTTVDDNGMYTVTKEETSGSTVTGLTISNSALSLTVGGTAQLTATATDSDGKMASVTWSTSRGDVATVNGGRVTAVGPGTATITVTAGGLTRSCTVTVSAPVTPVEPDDGRPSSGGSYDSEPSYSPVQNVSEGGTVKVSPRTAEEGDEVTITPNPDAGYEVADVTVTRNGRAIEVTENRDGTWTFTQPAGRVTIDVTFQRIGGEPAGFTDVPASFWAYDEITWAQENGYVNGTSATTFNPNGSISRQQVWMILARLSGYNPADMAAARAWAMSNGISDGSNPGASITRQQLAAILYRFARSEGYDTTAGGMAIREYPDYGSVADYAVEALNWAVSTGVVTGTTQGTLNPGGTATRAQFTVMLYRFWS